MRKSITRIDWRLYAIVDRNAIGNNNMAKVAEALAAGGVDAIQLRDKSDDTLRFFKDALSVKKITDGFGLPLLINDRADVAVAVDADGVHVGQDDLPIAAVRDLLGDDKIIGVSVHNQEEFEKVAAEKPAYLGVGTIFESGTKSSLPVTGTKLLETLRLQTNLPLIAIGGIDLANLAVVFQAGASGIAVISSLLKAADIKNKTREFVSKINEVKN